MKDCGSFDPSSILGGCTKIMSKGPEFAQIPPESSSKIEGLDLFLQHRDQIPVIESEIPAEWVDEARPLLATLEPEIQHITKEVLSGCALTIERLYKKQSLFKLRIPLSMIPIPQFAHVDESTWVDVDLNALRTLAHMGEVQADNFTRIIFSLRQFEEQRKVIIRGDGVICRAE